MVISRQKSNFIIFLAAGASLLIWGGTPIVTKIAVMHVEPLLVGILRTSLASIVVVPFALNSRLPRPENRLDFCLLIISSLGGFVGFPLLFSFGLSFTTSSHGALILAAVPIFTGIFAALLDRTKPTLLWFLGVCLAFLGEVLLIAFRFGFNNTGNTLLGDLLILCSCIAAAMGYVSGGKLSQRYGTWSTTVWGITLGGLLLTPLLISVARYVDWRAVDLVSWLAIGYLAFLSSVIGYATWYWALATGGIARVGVSQFVQPVISLLLSVLILNETLTIPLALTTALILLGVFIAQFSIKR